MTCLPISATLQPTLASATMARAFVEITLADAPERRASSAALCASELATNAILHVGTAFTVTVMSFPECVRLEVLDQHPALWPAPVPQAAVSPRITGLHETGRGLHIVASLSTNWGVTVTDDFTSVWCEVSDQPPNEPGQPDVLDFRTVEAAPPDARRYEFLDVPTALAVDSELAAEDALRDFQLTTMQDGATASVRTLELLRRTARIRLVARHAVMNAARSRKANFDLRLLANDQAIAEVRELFDLVTDVGQTFSPSVRSFRQWLREEAMRQRNGEAPTPCALRSE